MSRCAALLLLISLGCAPRASLSPAPPVPTATAPAMVVGEGESIQTAVRVPARTETEGVAWENDWIWRQYGRFRKKSVGLATLGGRRYDVVTVELSDHSERTVYFDITEFLGKKSKSPGAPPGLSRRV